MDFDLGGKTEEKKEGFDMTALMGAVLSATQTGNWSPVMDCVKPYLAPGIGGALVDYDKKGSTNASYIITKKMDSDGNLNVFLSVIERPTGFDYIADENGDAIVRDIGDLMDLIMKK